ncbi:MAG: Ktr system potassium transporter B, partial [Candidatus Sericytochromatia bacterium]|nr:Ktr system potassium transporter B [Candidatus Tanganyikabacteria bacterium]
MPRLSAYQLVVISFIVLIAAGTALLSLPFAQAGARHALIDDLFQATTTTCISGLVTLDPGSRYSPLGQIILLALIQAGGLGYMTMFSAGIVLIGKRLSLRDRVDLKKTADLPEIGGLRGFLVHVAVLTVAVQAAGAIILAFFMVPELGWRRGVYHAVFHAISAFNNAGLSLWPENAVHWQRNPPVLLTLAGLVILGGLGYVVTHELFRRTTGKRPETALNSHVRLVLGTTAFLLVSGTVVFWFFESGNPRTFGGLAPADRWVNAFFASAQARTAGYSSVDLGQATPPTLLSMMALMLIGGGPGGTAGGIKVTTAVIVLAAVIATIRGARDVNLFGFKRRLGEALVRKAMVVTLVSLLVVAMSTFLLACFEQDPVL